MGEIEARNVDDSERSNGTEEGCHIYFECANLVALSSTIATDTFQLKSIPV